MPATASDDLIRLFGDLAPRFGLSRPAGQCFAVVWGAAAPPSADDIVERLGISRSNVSTALKELRGWSLVATLREPGDRREYFTAPSDPWQLIRVVMAERRRRDLDPAFDRLIEIEGSAADARIAALCDATGALTRWLDALAQLDPAALRRQIEAGLSAPKLAEPRRPKPRPLELASVSAGAEDGAGSPSGTYGSLEDAEAKAGKKKKKKHRRD